MTEQQAYLWASNSDAADRFGRSVAISAGTVLAGAMAEDSNATGIDGDQGNNDASGAGAGYLLSRSGAVFRDRFEME